MSLPVATSYSELGGELSDLHPVEDPTTDLSAEANNISRCNVAMMSRTAVRAVVRFIGETGAPAVDSWEAQWKGSDSTAPVITHPSAGEYLITFPASVVNERGDEVSLNLWDAVAFIEGTLPYWVQAERTGPNTVYVYVKKEDGTANIADGLRIKVWVI